MSHVSEPRVWFTGNPSVNPIDFTGGHFFAHGSISCNSDSGDFGCNWSHLVTSCDFAIHNVLFAFNLLFIL